ncbi:acetyl-CoA carboxylase [Ferviditalea candida]|uniref:Biotin carboxyl carrier protein of acetyl-CoA carboxylase n=1 Tax=Ferviditalea candida TaxID=3108399 RepID=A0ABU5ZHS1_9BACL|nr:acetyl-CoA carboxylase [Paenibacillaceae bacterium T2]
MAAEQKIISPIPGVFYRRPSPEEEVYVKEGQSVNAGDTVGLIEVMKNFYEVKAEHNGILQKFLVENEQVINAGEELAVLLSEESI